jgi:hypothetical protein
MGRLPLGLFRVLGPNHIRHTVMIIRDKALVASRHSFVAGGHKLTGFLLPEESDRLGHAP